MVVIAPKREHHKPQQRQAEDRARAGHVLGGVDHERQDDDDVEPHDELEVAHRPSAESVSAAQQDGGCGFHLVLAQVPRAGEPHKPDAQQLDEQERLGERFFGEEQDDEVERGGEVGEEVGVDAVAHADVPAPEDALAAENHVVQVGQVQAVDVGAVGVEDGVGAERGDAVGGEHGQHGEGGEGESGAQREAFGMSACEGPHAPVVSASFLEASS